MGSTTSSLNQEISCPICDEIFKDPYILKCGHSFCRSCLKQFWERKENQECPLCGICSVDEPVLNLALKQVIDVYLQKSNNDPNQRELYCRDHGVKFLIFCEDDQELICCSRECQKSNKHRNHQHCAVGKAVWGKKEEVRTALKELKENVGKLIQVKKKYEEQSEQIKEIESQVTREFEELQRFLRSIEEDSIIALRKEEEEKSQRMKKKLENVSISLNKIIEEEQCGDDIAFLKNFQKIKKRVFDKIIKMTSSDPYGGKDAKVLSEELIDVGKYLYPLQFKAKQIIHGTEGLGAKEESPREDTDESFEISLSGKHLKIRGNTLLIEILFY
ncbi:tripartite motif-containing protein 35-like isoform X2 [Scleropages formosus]|uniref:tripartite motif-containing protein 35-like isoform X2 n=1 Tax=Scleropages formosus TaxID=113540 RepID=UPI0008787A9E|nr:tripartite motif-containing protein 35-like isoform X2 [Scleropages formosus]XP_029113183.1 tripartite motif-containing protein 35-like isoform X2 [Scleropages formosus]